MVDRLAGRATGPSRPASSTRAGSAPLYNLRDRLGIDIAFVDVGAGARSRTTSSPPSTRAIDDRTRAVVDQHVLWAIGRGPAGRAPSPTWPMRAARSSSSTARRAPVPSRSTSRPPARTSTRSPARSGCSGPRGWAPSRSRPVVRERTRAGLRRALHVRDRRLRTGAARALAGRAAVRGVELSPAVHRRHGPLDRLAEHVRRACDWVYERGTAMAPLRAGPPGGDRRRRGRHAARPRWRRSSRSAIARLAGRRPRSTSSARGCSPIARTIPLVDAVRISVGLLHLGGGARAARRAPSSCWPPTRRRRCRRAGR